MKVANILTVTVDSIATMAGKKLCSVWNALLESKQLHWLDKFSPPLASLLLQRFQSLSLQVMSCLFVSVWISDNHVNPD